jgi:CubicO group peptidase (beta-lactamase class C family)
MPLRRSAIALALLPALPALTAAQTMDRDRVAAAVDSLAADALRGNRAAGLTVAVVRGPDTLVHKGYGFADLELQVPTPLGAVYEIGSITKQFTAVAVLQLAEQGKLSLDDPLTRYLPTYPTNGHAVTIRRLMDHSSGIQGYTEMRTFGPLAVQRLPRDTLVALFSREPFKFAPGEAVAYNNSAYFLLGLVIEKVTGGTYADYVKKNLFDRAGMPDSRYCSEREIVPRRAHGYDATPAGLTLKGYIDHTWPYAAGSLCSTAGDLVAWTRALHGGRILSAASYRTLVTPETLNDGTRLRYAKGLVADSMAGRRVLAHGGGIPGFSTDLAYFPDEQVTITVLINTAGPVAPNRITQAIAELLFGRPAEPVAVALDHPAGDYAGTYRGIGRGDSLTLTITADGNAVRVRPATATGPGTVARYTGGDTFMIGRNRYTFLRDGDRVTAVRADMISVVSRLAKR